jgi:MFS family permease
VSRYRSVLRNRRLSFLLFGDLVSKLGDGMQVVVLPLLALRIHGGVGEATAVSLVVVAPLLLSLPLGLTAGLGRLRTDPRTLIVADCLLRTVAMTSLSFLALAGALHLWLLFTLLLLGATLRSVSGAARRVLATESIGDEERLVVNSVLSTSDSTAVYILGPGLGGLLLVLSGPWLPLLLDGAGCALLVVAVLAMPRVGARDQGRTAADAPAASGWEAMRRAPGLWSLFFVVFAYNLLWGPVEVVLPLFVEHDLGSGEAFYGYLMTALGIGAVIGSFAAGFLDRFSHARALALLIVGWGGSLTLVAAAPNVYVAFAGIAVGGLVWAPFIPVMYTVVQNRIARAEHQAVLTFWGSGYNIAGPVGVLVGVPVIALIGTRGTMMLSAALTVALVVPALLAERRLTPAQSPPAPDGASAAEDSAPANAAGATA